MKKLFVKIVRLFSRNNVLLTVKEGGFKFVFRKRNLTIHSDSDIVRFVFRADSFMYGYLYAAACTDKKEQVHSYGALLYIVSYLLLKDQDFVDSVIGAVNKYDANVAKDAEKKAGSVSEEMEKMEAEFMRDVDRRSRMTEKERKAEEKYVRSEMKKSVSMEEVASILKGNPETHQSGYEATKSEPEIVEIKPAVPKENAIDAEKLSVTKLPKEAKTETTEAYVHEAPKTHKSQKAKQTIKRAPKENSTKKK